ncbi:MAG TPA: polysaccharide biosynthesis tyrosine autokinase [Burkholderiaceae bacterium]|nr:polysaccharide biosynthesis tyrosine autokinase [Burkholderiaceae bacterium]
MNISARRELASPVATPVGPLVQPVSAFDSSEPESTLSGTFNTLLQNLPLVAIAFLATVALGILYLLLAPSVYRVDALVQLDDRKQTAALTGSSPASAYQLPSTPLLGEIDILRSRELLLKAVAVSGADIDVEVANRMPLVGRAYARWRTATQEQGIAPAPLGLRAFSWGGERLRLAAFDVPSTYLDRKFTLVGNGSKWILIDDDGKPVAQGTVAVPATFSLGGGQARVLVSQMLGAPGVRFSIERHSPAVVYEELLKRKLQIMESTRQSGVIRLAYETNDPERGVRLLDELTRSYVQYTVQRRASEAEQSLRFVEEQLPNLKKQLDQSERALATFRSRTSTLNADQETQNLLVRSQALQRDMVENQLKTQEMAKLFTPNHPEMQTLRRQRQIIEDEMRRLQGSIATLPANQRDLVQLQREAQTNATLYTALLSSAQELRLTRAGMTASARVVDPPAATERPVKPMPAVVLSIAAGLGLIMGVVLAFMRRQLHPTVQDGDDIEAQTGFVTLAQIPESNRQRQLMRWYMPRGDEPRLLARRAPAEPAVESLRSFRSTLTLSEDPEAPKTLLLAAPTAGVGKTFIAANLSALMAASHRRVLLVDADLRRARLHRYFEVSNGPGLAEVLAGRAKVSDVIQRGVLPNLDLLLAGRAHRNPADLLASPALRRLLETLEKRYDCVVVDSAPVLPVSDALNFAQRGLRTFLVARSEHTTTRELRESGRRIEAVGGRVDGVLFNGIKRARFGGMNYYGYPETAA